MEGVLFLFKKKINNYSFQMPANQSFFDSEDFQNTFGYLSYSDLYF
jgi:hypothetical protein